MSKKLLLADDSITIQKVIGITFANEDYDLTIVDNGDAALQKAQADKPQLILADVFMPGKNGYELCAAVKQDPGLQDVPVLLLTGTFEPFDEEKAISSGANGWISKPFESQALIAKVEELIGGRAQSAPAASQPAAPVAPSPVPPPAAPIEPIEPISADPDNWGDVSFDETPEVVPTSAAEPMVFEDDSDFIIDDGAASSADTSDVWADTASIPLVEPEVVAVEPAPAQVATPPTPTPPAPAPVTPQPAAPAATSAAGVEAQIAGMSEADLQKIIEKVAGAILERVAWEVVPDLAENLVKDEIRKIKQGA